MSNPVWRPLPHVRVRDSVTAVAVAGNAIFAGNSGGLFQKQGKEAWKRLNLTATEVQALAIGDSDQHIGAGSGGIVDVTQDGGKTWERGETDPSARITCLSLAGAEGLAGTEQHGVFVTFTSGKTWRPAGLEGQMVLAVCGSDLAGTDQGLYRRGRETALGKLDWRKLGVDGVVTAIARSGKTVVVGTEESGLHRSTDDGKTWQKCQAAADGINAVAASGQRFAAATSTGEVLVSEDGGVTWAALPALSAAPIAVAVSPQAVFAGCYGAGFFACNGKEWTEDNQGLETTNAIDLIASSSGPLLLCADGLRRLKGDAWEVTDTGVPGTPRAIALRGNDLLLATDEGLYDGKKKLADFRDVTAIRVAPNGDLAVLTEESLHVGRGGSWTTTGLRSNEKVIGLAFAPGYPEDDSLLLGTLRMLTHVSVVRFETKTQAMDRLLDYDARARWFSFALPANYRVDPQRPAGFYAGAGNQIFRPVWPGQTWQRDLIHDVDATVLSVAISPNYPKERTVIVGTTNGIVYSENDGLLWINAHEGLDDPRVIKLVFAADGSSIYCLTPTRVYQTK